MKKNIVIGANGFIGRNLIATLKKDSKVIGVYHSNNDGLYSDIKNISSKDLENLENDFDVVYILSAFIAGGQLSVADRKNLFKVNVQMVDTICKKFSNSRIIYVSSVSVYKESNDSVLEQSEEGGINEYGISKLWGEKIIERCNNYSIVRLSSVYGIGMKLNTIIPNYIKQALQNYAISIWGDGQRKQNYIHVSDVVNFLKKAAIIHENGIYLGTASESISNLELAKIIAQKTDCSLSFINDDISPSFCYDNKYSVTKLNYYPTVTIEKGISELIEWIKEKY